MKKLKFWVFASIMITFLGPFFLLGASAGQFAAAVWYGYKTGRRITISRMKALTKAARE